MIVVASSDNDDKTYQVPSQAALDSLLRQFHVHALLEQNEYSCEVSHYDSLSHGGRYVLGESLASVELQELYTKNKSNTFVGGRTSGGTVIYG